MTYQDIMKDQYDVVYLTRKGEEKRAHYAQNALWMDKLGKTTGNFVSVMADIFLKLERGNGSYR